MLKWQFTFHSMSCFHGKNTPTGVASTIHSLPPGLRHHGGPGPPGRTAVVLSVREETSGSSKVIHLTSRKW